MTPTKKPNEGQASQPILTSGSVSEFFHEVVEEAIRARRVDVTGGATTYLVALLSEYARPDYRADEAFDKPLAFLLDEALSTHVPAERFERLRYLGDGVLYVSGFFGDHWVARGVDSKYLIGIGSVAYGHASSMLRTPKRDDAESPALDIYLELAEKFSSFVEVLTEVADGTIAKGSATSKGLLRIYERWLKTGSEKLASTLSSHGLVPMAGAKGLQ